MKSSDTDRSGVRARTRLSPGFLLVLVLAVLSGLDVSEAGRAEVSKRVATLRTHLHNFLDHVEELGGTMKAGTNLQRGLTSQYLDRYRDIITETFHEKHVDEHFRRKREEGVSRFGSHTVLVHDLIDQVQEVHSMKHKLRTHGKDILGLEHSDPEFANSFLELHENAFQRAGTRGGRRLSSFIKGAKMLLQKMRIVLKAILRLILNIATNMHVGVSLKGKAAKIPGLGPSISICWDATNFLVETTKHVSGARAASCKTVQCSKSASGKIQNKGHDARCSDNVRCGDAHMDECCQFPMCMPDFRCPVGRILTTFEPCKEEPCTTDECCTQVTDVTVSDDATPQNDMTDDEAGKFTGAFNDVANSADSASSSESIGVDEIVEGNLGILGIDDPEISENETLLEIIERNSTGKFGFVSKMASGVSGIGGRAKALLRLILRGVRHQFELGREECNEESAKFRMCVDIGIMFPGPLVDLDFIVGFNRNMLGCTMDGIAKVMEELSEDIDIRQHPKTCRNDIGGYMTEEEDEDEENYRIPWKTDRDIDVDAWRKKLSKNEVVIHRVDAKDVQKRHVGNKFLRSSAVLPETIDSENVDEIRTSEVLKSNSRNAKLPFELDVDYEAALKLAEKNGFGAPKKIKSIVTLVRQESIHDRALKKMSTNRRLRMQQKRLGTYAKRIGARAVLDSLENLSTRANLESVEDAVIGALERPDIDETEDTKLNNIVLALQDSQNGYAKQCQVLNNVAGLDLLSHLRLSSAQLESLSKFLVQELKFPEAYSRALKDALSDTKKDVIEQDKGLNIFIGPIGNMLEDLWSHGKNKDSVGATADIESSDNYAYACSDTAVQPDAGYHTAQIIDISEDRKSLRLRHVDTGIEQCNVSRSTLFPVPDDDYSQRTSRTSERVLALGDHVDVATRAHGFCPDVLPGRFERRSAASVPSSDQQSYDVTYGIFSAVRRPGSSVILGTEEGVSDRRLGLLFAIGDIFGHRLEDGTIERARIIGFDRGRGVLLQMCGRRVPRSSVNPDRNCLFDGDVHAIPIADIPVYERPQHLIGRVYGVRQRSDHEDDTLSDGVPTYRTATIVDVLRNDTGTFDEETALARNYMYSVRYDVTNHSADDMWFIEHNVSPDRFTKFEVGAGIRWIGSERVAECHLGCGAETASMGVVTKIHSDSTYDVRLGSADGGTVYIDPESKESVTYIQKVSVLESALERSLTDEFYSVATKTEGNTSVSMFCPERLPAVVVGIEWREENVTLPTEDGPLARFIPFYHLQYGLDDNVIIGYERAVVGARVKSTQEYASEDEQQEETPLSRTANRRNTGFMLAQDGNFFEAIKKTKYALATCFRKPLLYVSACLAKVTALTGLEGVQHQLAAMDMMIDGVISKLNIGRTLNEDCERSMIVNMGLAPTLHWPVGLDVSMSKCGKDTNGQDTHIVARSASAVRHMRFEKPAADEVESDRSPQTAATLRKMQEEASVNTGELSTSFSESGSSLPGCESVESYVQIRTDMSMWHSLLYKVAGIGKLAHTFRSTFVKRLASFGEILPGRVARANIELACMRPKMMEGAAGIQLGFGANTVPGLLHLFGKVLYFSVKTAYEKVADLFLFKGSNDGIKMGVFGDLGRAMTSWESMKDIFPGGLSFSLGFIGGPLDKIGRCVYSYMKKQISNIATSITHRPKCVLPCDLLPATTKTCDECVADNKYFCPKTKNDRERCVKHLTVDQKKFCTKRCDACSVTYDSDFGPSTGRRPQCMATSDRDGVCQKCLYHEETCTRNSDCDSGLCSGNLFSLTEGKCAPSGRLGGVFCKRDHHCASGSCVKSVVSNLRAWGACAVSDAEQAQIDLVYRPLIKSSWRKSRSTLLNEARDRQRKRRAKERSLLGGESCSADTDCLSSHEAHYETCESTSVSVLSRDDCERAGCKWSTNNQTCTNFKIGDKQASSFCFGKGSFGMKMGVCLRSKRSIVEEFFDRKLGEEKLRVLRDREISAPRVRMLSVTVDGGNLMTFESGSGKVQFRVPSGLRVGDRVQITLPPPMIVAVTIPSSTSPCRDAKVRKNARSKEQCTALGCEWVEESPRPGRCAEKITLTADDCDDDSVNATGVPRCEGASVIVPEGVIEGMRFIVELKFG